jgi:hypothetical protein
MDDTKLFGALSACLDKLSACLDKVHHRRSFRAFALALVVGALFGLAVCGLKAPQALPSLMRLAYLIVAFAGFVVWHDRRSAHP